MSTHQKEQQRSSTQRPSAQHRPTSKDAEILWHLYREVLKIRRAEETIARRYAEQEMRCPVHLSIGQEAAPVGVCAALRNDDEMVGSHRSHAHYLAKGGRLSGLVGELYGKATGCAGGHGGSMHLVDLDAGFLAATSIVAGTVPIGVGAAWANRLLGKDNIVVVCLGDAALEEGVVHEAMNFASLHKLAVLFLCENNRYSCFTRIGERQPARPLTTLAAGHGLLTRTDFGNDAFSVMRSVAACVSGLRRGGGPVFLELETYRYLEHCGPNDDDNLKYRPREEVDHFKTHDPLIVLRSQLEDVKAHDARRAESIENEVNDDVERAFESARVAEWPTPVPPARVIYAV